MSSKIEPEFEVVTGFKPSAKMLAIIHQLVEECVKKCVEKDLEKAINKSLDPRIKKIVQECLQKEKYSKFEVVELRKIPKEKAVALVNSYIAKHEGCRTSDIIYDLALDPELVLEVLNELKRKRRIKGESL